MAHADVAQLVERNLAKVEVAGSIPVVRSEMGETVEFPSNGGDAVGYLAVPATTPAPGVLVIQEWWGLAPRSSASATAWPTSGSSRSPRTCTTARSPSTPRWTGPRSS